MQRKEVWKPIKGYEGKYEISNLGGVRNRKRGNKLLPYRDGRNHLKVGLHHDGKQKHVFVHRLIYEAFVGEIPDGYVIHHIDHNQFNNCVDNLKLMSRSEHMSLHRKGKTLPNHNTEKMRIAAKRACQATKKPVAQYSLDGELIGVYESISEAHRKTGVGITGISRCCLKKVRKSGNYYWEFRKKHDFDKNIS